MIADALLAWTHFVLVFGLCGCLLAEALFYRAELGREVLARLRSVDLAYGILAGVVVLSGIASVLYSPKGAAFYLHNPIFWTKMGLFGLVALLSIPPTLHFLALGRTAAAPDGTVRVARRTYAAMRAYLIAELALLLLIPCCAAFMARGFGLAN